MSLQFSFRHMESSAAIEELITKKIEKVGKIVEYPLDFRVIVSAHKLEHTVEINCHAEHQDFTAKATTEDLYSSIDDAIHKLETQFKKEREKRKGHHSAQRNGEFPSDVAADLPHAGKNGRK